MKPSSSQERGAGSSRRPAKRQGDSVEGAPGDRPFETSATAWLVGQAVRYLNTAGKEGEAGYGRVIELLRNCADVDDTFVNLLRSRFSDDTALRWNLLRVFGDVATSTAAGFLADVALEPLPEVRRHRGCGDARDGELLARASAVHALSSVARRHPEAVEELFRIVAERPDRAVLVEAVKSAADTGQQARLREGLADEDRWILDIRRARPQEIYIEPEREDGTQRTLAPPDVHSEAMAPRVGGRARKDC